MIYNIKNHPTKYKEIMFRSRLEARWAVYFDLLELNWQYEPIDLNGWTPDFLLDIPCYNSQCKSTLWGQNHRLLIEVKPYAKIEEFKNHACMKYFYNQLEQADSSAAFGINPFVTYWECCHGSGGGQESLETWNMADTHLWNKAGNQVQYLK